MNCIICFIMNNIINSECKMPNHQDVERYEIYNHYYFL